jgi:hypothetical protein
MIDGFDVDGVPEEFTHLTVAQRCVYFDWKPIARG